MSQPRKFSDKIALLMQKQAEDAEAFENILREIQPLTTGNITEVKLINPFFLFLHRFKCNHSNFLYVNVLL